MLKSLLFLALIANIVLKISSTDVDHEKSKTPKKPSNDCNEKKCPGNETYVECPDFDCNPRTCDDLGFPQTCTVQDNNDACPGKPACLCVTDYVRNDCGLCIPMKQCPSCGGDPNAQSGCGVNCNKHCSNYNKEPGFCPLVCKANGCDCKPDFVYDDNIQKCVSPKDCTPVCKANEVYSDCVNGGCHGPRTCLEKGQPEICVDPIKCEDGCICIDGYLRDEAGKCVPADECPSDETCTKCTGANEEYVPCPDTCTPQTCDSIGKRYNCPNESADKSNCKGACRCKSGYYRNAIQQCVSEAECKKCTGENEYYDTCPPFCSPQTCDSIGKKLFCPAHTDVCEPACRCIKNYYRNKHNKCIPEKECCKSTSTKPPVKKNDDDEDDSDI